MFAFTHPELKNEHGFAIHELNILKPKFIKAINFSPVGLQSRQRVIWDSFQDISDSKSLYCKIQMVYPQCRPIDVVCKLLYYKGLFKSDLMVIN